MTGFRLFCCQLLLLLCCVSAAFATAQENATSPTVVKLQQENAALQRQVKRLEVQVTALREELNTPGATQIIGGIGYIVGIFGIAGWFAARKNSGREN